MNQSKTQSSPHKSFDISKYKESNKIDPAQCLFELDC